MSEKIKSNPETDHLSPAQLAERMEQQEERISTAASSSPPSGGNISQPRAALGEVMEKSTDLVNDNLIAARYAAFAGIALLTAYGLSNTPLFFRFRSVAEIPRSYFLSRKSLYGRIISVHHHPTSNNALTQDGSQTIQLMVRNLSPIGMLLPTSWFEFLMKISPSSRFSHGLSSNAQADDSRSKVLKIQIAGIQSPPISRDSYNPQQFLEQLAKQRTLVSCQLLGREVTATSKDGALAPEKRQISEVLPELKEGNSDDDRETDAVAQILDWTKYNGPQVAICKLHYRPTYLQLFATDIAESLVKAGNANVTSSMLQGDASSTTSNDTKIVDSSQRINDLRKDIKYLDRLAKVEFEAAKKLAGMWSVPEVRQMKKEVVEEVEFQSKSNIFQKAWRYIRGG